MNRAEREFELIVWGATGFTGRLVAEYLAAAEGAGLRWAVAGRNRGKLDEVAAAVARSAPAARMQDVPRLLADSDDLDSLRALARRTRVLVSTVGPYALHGSALVQACAECGTDYVDLTGEPHWIRRMIDAWQGAATASGARILHSCGFDSVPFDMGVWYLQRALQAQGRGFAREIHGVVRRMRGGFSGGTFASMLNFVEEAARDPALRRLAANANALVPAAKPEYLREGVAWEPALGLWTGPFVMAAINTKTVRRSHALLGYPWGPVIRYTESMAIGTGTGARLRAHALHAGMGAFVLGASLGPTRALLRRLMPKPGEGPDAQARESGFYEIDFVGLDAGGRELGIARVSGDRDPGYGSTSRMLAECALALARDAVPAAGGMWTAASCLGEPLLARLEARAGLRFSLREPG
jgi:short subunit dehydrogenase-like uncharacterized protein